MTKEHASNSSGLGEKIKQLLSERRVSITALAEYTGISRPTLYRILEGRSELRFKDVFSISKFFNIPLETFYALEQESPAPSAEAALHFGLSRFDETTWLQKIYKNLARKELAKILREAADMLESDEK